MKPKTVKGLNKAKKNKALYWVGWTFNSFCLTDSDFVWRSVQAYSENEALTKCHDGCMIKLYTLRTSRPNI